MGSTSSAEAEAVVGASDCVVGVVGRCPAEFAVAAPSTASCDATVPAGGGSDVALGTLVTTDAPSTTGERVVAVLGDAGSCDSGGFTTGIAVDPLVAAIEIMFVPSRR